MTGAQALGLLLEIVFDDRVVTAREQLDLMDAIPAECRFITLKDPTGDRYTLANSATITLLWKHLNDDAYRRRGGPHGSSAEASEGSVSD